MILELDWGNSLIKWRALGAGVVVARGALESIADLPVSLRGAQIRPSVCRLVSVRSEGETAQLCDAVVGEWGIAVHVAQAQEVLAGICNGYEDYQRLGLDRWLALVAAAKLSAQGCLVLDLGTAVTADYVDRDGRHLGGFICPGVKMMCGELRSHTRRIEFSGDAPDAEFRRPGRNTGDAVRRGALLMLRAFVEAQLGLAGEWLGEHFEVFVTGGDAALVADLMPQARVVPDLVFLGLAHACPLQEA
jgi:type III pantothenate kinase